MCQIAEAIESTITKLETIFYKYIYEMYIGFRETPKVYLFDLCNLEDDHIFSRSSQRVEKPKTFF